MGPVRPLLEGNKREKREDPGNLEAIRAVQVFEPHTSIHERDEVKV